MVAYDSSFLTVFSFAEVPGPKRTLQGEFRLRKKGGRAKPLEDSFSEGGGARSLEACRMIYNGDNIGFLKNKSNGRNLGHR